MSTYTVTMSIGQPSDHEEIITASDDDAAIEAARYAVCDGWLDLSVRFAALPGWATEAVVTTQPAMMTFFPGGPYRYTYDDGVFKFYECDGGQVADHGVLDLRGTTRYPVNNLSVAEIVVAHWDFFKACHGSLWDADCAAHIDPVERSKWTVATRALTMDGGGS